MIQLNLLPDVKKEFIKTQRLKRNIISGAIIGSGVAIGLIVLLAIYVHVAQRVARNQLQGDINKSSQELSSKQDLSKVLTVQGALNALPSLYDQKTITSRFFDYLRVVMPNQTVLTKLDADLAKRTLKLDGTAADYKSLNIFVDTLKNAQLSYGTTDKRSTVQAFKNVIITSANSSNDVNKPGVTFNLTMEFDQLLFKSTTQSPSLTIPAAVSGPKTNEVFSTSSPQGAKQ